MSDTRIKPALLTYTQAIEATVASVRAQLKASGTSHSSTNLLRRHAAKHIGSDERSLVDSVVDAARAELQEPA